MEEQEVIIGPTFPDTMLALGQVYASEFRAGRMQVEQIVRFESVRGCLVCMYDVLVARKKIIPLERLTEEDKRELWEEARATAKELDMDERVKFCKAVYTLNNLL